MTDEDLPSWCLECTQIDSVRLCPACGCGVCRVVDMDERIACSGTGCSQSIHKRCQRGDTALCNDCALARAPAGQNDDAMRRSRKRLRRFVCSDPRVSFDDLVEASAAVQDEDDGVSLFKLVTLENGESGYMLRSRVELVPAAVQPLSRAAALLIESLRKQHAPPTALPASPADHPGPPPSGDEPQAGAAGAASRPRARKPKAAAAPGVARKRKSHPAPTADVTQVSPVEPHGDLSPDDEESDLEEQRQRRVEVNRLKLSSLNAQT